jgi:hypothetical protein
MEQRRRQSHFELYEQKCPVKMLGGMALLLTDRIIEDGEFHCAFPI